MENNEDLTRFIDKTELRKLSFWSIASLVVGGFAVTWLIDAFRALLFYVRPSMQVDNLFQSLLFFAFGIIGIIITYLIVRYQALPSARRAFRKTKATITHRGDSTARAFPAIVSTLSPLRPEQHQRISTFVEQIEADRAAGRPMPQIADLVSKDPDLAKPIHGTPWQQTLRVIEYNLSAQPLVYFVLSEEASRQFGLFQRLVTCLLGQNVIIFPEESHQWDRADACVDLSNYEQVADRVEVACHHAAKLARCRIADLCVDITPGFKTYSAAATVLTLNSDASFCYVGTFNEGRYEGQVLVYRARLVA